MSRLTALGFCLLFAVLSGCTEKQYQEIELPESPDGALKARAFVLEETTSIKINEGEEIYDFDPLVIGQCNRVKFFWVKPRQAVLQYDSIQIAQFVSSPRYFAGANVSLCHASSGACGVPLGKVLILPGCDDASL